jgi:hypothetical protein
VADAVGAFQGAEGHRKEGKQTDSSLSQGGGGQRASSENLRMHTPASGGGVHTWTVSGLSAWLRIS